MRIRTRDHSPELATAPAFSTAQLLVFLAMQDPSESSSQTVRETLPAFQAECAEVRRTRFGDRPVSKEELGQALLKHFALQAARVQQPLHVQGEAEAAVLKIAVDASRVVSYVLGGLVGRTGAEITMEAGRLTELQLLSAAN